MESEGKGGQHTGREDFFFFRFVGGFAAEAPADGRVTEGDEMVSESARARRPRTETPVPRCGLASGLDGGGGGGLWFVRVSEDVRFQVRNQVRVVSILSAQLHPSFPLPASFSSLSLSNSLPGCSRPTRRPCLLLMVGRRFFTELHFFFSDISGKRSRIDRGCVAGEASAGELH